MRRRSIDVGIVANWACPMCGGQNSDDDAVVYGWEESLNGGVTLLISPCACGFNPGEVFQGLGDDGWYYDAEDVQA